MKYTYVDGSNNKYRLDKAKLEYVPMTPELSSSGTYSGGEAFAIELEKMDLIKVIDVFERALWSEGDQTDQRTMGSGTLLKSLGDESQKVYLKMKSSAMLEINVLLEGIKGRM